MSKFIKWCFYGENEVRKSMAILWPILIGLIFIVFWPLGNKAGDVFFHYMAN